jgi:hypothetical protein
MSHEKYVWDVNERAFLTADQKPTVFIDEAHRFSTEEATNQFSGNRYMHHEPEDILPYGDEKLEIVKNFYAVYSYGGIMHYEPSEISIQMPHGRRHTMHFKLPESEDPTTPYLRHDDVVCWAWRISTGTSFTEWCPGANPKDCQ